MVFNIQRELQAVLDGINMASLVLLKCGKNDGIVVYVSEENIVKETWHPN
jgi:hypothetical protein